MKPQLWILVILLLIGGAILQHGVNTRIDDARAKIQHQRSLESSTPTASPFEISYEHPFQVILHRGVMSPIVHVSQKNELKWQLHTPDVRVAIYLDGVYKGTQDPINSIEYARGRRVNVPSGNFQLLIPLNEPTETGLVIMWFE